VAFELLKAPNLAQTKPPTEEELCILREEVAAGFVTSKPRPRYMSSRRRRLSNPWRVALTTLAAFLEPSDLVRTSFTPADSKASYYGLESQPLIRQIGFKVSRDNPVEHRNNEFMVELYNPFDQDVDANDFTLLLRSKLGEEFNTIIETIRNVGYLCRS
jgi:hypothetical protein